MDETWQSHMNWHDKKRETQITLPHCELWVAEDMTYESIPNGSAKSQNKLKYSSQAQKKTPNGRASREAKWVFATVASHLCLTLFICYFIFLLFCFLKPHSLSLPFFFLLFCSVAVKAMGTIFCPRINHKIKNTHTQKQTNKQNKKKHTQKDIITKIKKQKNTQSPW